MLTTNTKKPLSAQQTKQECTYISSDTFTRNAIHRELFNYTPLTWREVFIYNKKPSTQNILIKIDDDASFAYTITELFTKILELHKSFKIIGIDFYVINPKYLNLFKTYFNIFHKEGITKELKYLSFQASWYIENLKLLINFKEITYLYLHNFNNLKDLDELKSFQKLEELYFIGCEEIDLKTLPLLEKLKHLCIRHQKNLKSLEGIEKLPNLETLSISRTRQLNDISHLSNCKNLKELSLLWTNNIQSLSFLENCKKLEKLSCDITTGYFSNLKNLTQLYFCCYDIRDLSQLKESTKLQKLEIVDSYFGSLKGLENFTNLTELIFKNGSKLSKLETLTALQNLEKLVIKKCAIDTSNLEVLKYAQNLRKLTISGCKQLNSLAGIENCTNLKSLNITKTKITSIEEIKDLTNLERLTLINNELQDTTSASSLTQLKTLDIYP